MKAEQLIADIASLTKERGSRPTEMTLSRSDVRELLDDLQALPSTLPVYAPPPTAARYMGGALPRLSKPGYALTFMGVDIYRAEPAK